jgi:hypothetical protein
MYSYEVRVRDESRLKNGNKARRKKLAFIPPILEANILKIY